MLIKNLLAYAIFYIGLSKRAPKLYLVVILLVIAGFLNIIGFIFLVPVIDSLLFGSYNNENILFGIFIENVINREIELMDLFLLVIISLMGGFIFQAYGSYLSYKSRFQLIKNMRVELTELHSKQNLSYIYKKHAGNFNDLILNQTEQAGAGYYTIYSFWISVLQVLTYIIIGFILSYQLTFLIIFCFLSIGLISGILQIKTRKYSKLYTKGFQNLGLLVGDYNNNIKTFRVSKLLNVFVKNHHIQTKKIANGLTKIYRLLVSQTFILQALSVLIIFFVIIVREDFGLIDSMVLVFLATLRKIAGHMQDMLNNALAFQSYSAAIELIDIEKQSMKNNLEKNGKVFLPKIDSINLIDVTFEYSKNKPIFSNLSFSIRKKETILISGDSGSGKSTLLDLFLLFHKPTKGILKINNINAVNIDKIKFREKVAYVPQSGSLNYGNIRSNLCMGQKISDDELIKTCELTQIYSWIKSLENGFETLVGEKGVNMSGGQIQRLILARALLQKPEILILDESTSALDQENETKINELLKKIKGEMIIIIVTHKIFPMSFADKYLIFKGGKLYQLSEYEDAMGFING